MAAAGDRDLLALLGDLLLESRLEEVGTRLGLRVRAVASLAALPAALAAGAPDLVVLDLASPQFGLAPTLAALRAAGSMPPVLAFHPHVDKDLGRAAREAGCTIVVPRSRFAAELPALLQQALGLPAAAGG